MMNSVAVGLARAGVRGLCIAFLVAVAGLLLAPPLWAQDTQGASAVPSSAGLPASIPVKREPASAAVDPTGDRWWLAIASAGILLALVVIIARKKERPAKSSRGSWWTRFPTSLVPASSHEIGRISNVRLSPRHSLHVVTWNGRRLLLGCSDQSIQLLAEAASAPQAEAEEDVLAPNAQAASKAPS